MTDLQILDALMDQIDRQSQLIRALVYELKQQNAISDEIADRLYEADRSAEKILGEIR